MLVQKETITYYFGQLILKGNHLGPDCAHANDAENYVQL